MKSGYSDVRQGRGVELSPGNLWLPFYLHMFHVVWNRIYCFFDIFISNIPKVIQKICMWNSSPHYWVLNFTSFVIFLVCFICFLMFRLLICPIFSAA